MLFKIPCKRPGLVLSRLVKANIRSSDTAVYAAGEIHSSVAYEIQISHHPIPSIRFLLPNHEMIVLKHILERL